MQEQTPPFRAEHVGSLLRPDVLKDARAKAALGQINAEDLRAVEDDAIAHVIAKQESLGFRGITDGEFRRAYWSRDFFRYIDGVETFTPPPVVRFKGPQPKTLAHRPKAKLGRFAGHPMLEHFRFLKAHTSATPKMTIPAPSAFQAYRGRTVIGEDIYPSIDDFYHDLGETYRKAVHAFAEAGCRYLQFDEVYLTLLADPAQRQLFEQHGTDTKRLPDIHTRIINAALSDAPRDMVFAMHLCRGNFRSTYMGTGGYEAIADILFNRMNINVYFMEYDSARAGGFEPLRLVPKNKKVVLGLITSKSGALEDKEVLKRRIEEAGKFIDLDRVSISPQCGFASTEEGNLLTEEEQWAKLSLTVEVAEEVWGTS